MKITLSKSQWESIGLKAGWKESQGLPNWQEVAVRKAKQTKNDQNIEFFTTRQKGAVKIAKIAKEKGGPSILTFWHFKAKETPYNDVLMAIKDEEPQSHYEDQCKQLLKKLDVENMTQKEFQEVMGAIEVWGEAICQLSK